MEPPPFALPAQVKDLGAKAMGFAGLRSGAKARPRQRHAGSAGVQSEYVRAQMAAIQEQARELGALARADIPKR
jgi:hypothetical protein